jgi:hypothetical protein
MEAKMKIRALSGRIVVVALGVLVFSSRGFSVAPDSAIEKVKHVVSEIEDAPVPASKGEDTLKSFGARIAGTYLAIRQPDAGPTRILTIFADGNLTSIQSIQFGQAAANGGFSNQQGVWKRVGEREIEATILDLAYDLATGEFLGTTIAHYDLRFDDSFQRVTGRDMGKVFGPGVDPLNPGETKPIAEFRDDFQAQRVAVGNSANETRDPDHR